MLERWPAPRYGNLATCPLTVVGLNRSDRVQEAGAAEGIQAAVFIVPLPVGRGTRLKIFEALAMGKAMVSTEVGVEGLPVITASTTFGRHDGRLRRERGRAPGSAARRRSLRLAGRLLVEARFSLETVAHQFEAACVDVVGRGRA
jgi:glycosyltransferase involved in cell wall biosynthesis